MEIWKDIIGYEGRYQVSNLGRVKSLNYNNTNKEKILKPKKESNGYLRVNLSKNGKAKMHSVHRLVAIAYIPNPENKETVNHKNENKEDNRVENLEWMTSYENNRYGTHDIRSASKQKNNKKTSKPVVGVSLIGEEVLRFPSTAEAERQGKFFHSAVGKCCNGKSKSYKGYVWYWEKDYAS